MVNRVPKKLKIRPQFWTISLHNIYILFGCIKGLFLCKFLLRLFFHILIGCSKFSTNQSSQNESSVVLRRNFNYRIKSSAQSNKHFTLVNYDSRVVIWGIFKSGTTLESSRNLQS